MVRVNKLSCSDIHESSGEHLSRPEHLNMMMMMMMMMSSNDAEDDHYGGHEFVGNEHNGQDQKAS